MEGIKRLVPQEVTIPVSKAWLIRKLNVNTIHDVKVLAIQIDLGQLIVSGKTKKWLLWIPFRIVLEPAGSACHTIRFRSIIIEKMHFNALNDKSFQRTPYNTNDNKIVRFDLNQSDPIANLSLEKIKDFCLEKTDVLVTFTW